MSYVDTEAYKQLRRYMPENLDTGFTYKDIEPSPAEFRSFTNVFYRANIVQDDTPLTIGADFKLEKDT